MFSNRLIKRRTLEANKPQPEVQQLEGTIETSQTTEQGCQTIFIEYDVNKFKGTFNRFSYSPHQYLSKDSAGNSIIIADASTQVSHSNHEHKNTRADASCGTDSTSIAFFEYESVLQDGTLQALTSVRQPVFVALLLLLATFKPRSHKKEDLLLMALIKLKTGAPFTILAALWSINRETLRSSF